MVFRLSDTPSKRCAVLKCQGMRRAGQPGKYCDKHRHFYMDHGAAEVGPMDRQLRRLYIDVVMRRLNPKYKLQGKRLSRVTPLNLSDRQKRSMAEVLTDLGQILQMLPAPKSFYELGRGSGMTARDKAEQALAWIVKQRGLELAKTLILAHAVGAEVCPKLNTSERYRLSQVAKSVLMLLAAETVKDFIGRPVKKKFPGRGWFFKKELVKIIEPSYYFWVKDGIRDALQTELKAETEQRTLELHGVNVKIHHRLTRAREQARDQDRIEARVGTPVDPSCPSCLEHGWRFACAVHNTDEERAARWKP